MQANVRRGTVSVNLNEKPEIDFPIGDAPTELQIRDIVVGDGEEAKSGQVVSVRYVGVTFETGEEFDASWNRGTAPFQFPLGKGRVIKGWDQGVAGMKVGGRRELTIPSHLAYGAQSPTPAIPPYSTLIFVVDLLGV
ncbi:FKBP-type peptidyl-prolyl cis-trans isomerase [Kitasatospora sp. NPDC048286]|uniref:FKBP-type peptidyl-prolyl cis-trans isomerase n=1 Tax=Kitasatospora sp. NPDC048286 TaxID=3364047 RepID=UPI0037182B5A